LAIYIAITDDDLRGLLPAWGVPGLQAAMGLPAGSINTNVALEFVDGTRAFLRYSTVRSEADLAFEAEILAALESAGLRGPRLHLPRGGGHSVAWGGGRVSLFHWLEGVELARKNVQPAHLRTLGALLARVHAALSRVTVARANPYGAETVAGWLRQLEQEAHPGLEGLPGMLLQAQSEAAALLAHATGVPTGTIHADLFLDNVKWLSADAPVPFDYEMACTAPLVQDLAIALDAWCFEGEYLRPLAQALLEGYGSVRPLGPEELALLYPAALCGAVRFTTSRIRDFHLSPLSDARLLHKDYRTWLARVRALQAMGPGGFRRWLEGRD
jgi:homoserine kinase type II